MTKTIDDLPDEILIHIFSFLDNKKTDNIGLVCKKWEQISNDNTRWAPRLKKLAKAHNIHFDDKSLGSINCKHVFMRLSPVLRLRLHSPKSSPYMHYLIGSPDMHFVQTYLDKFNPNTTPFSINTPIWDLLYAKEIAQYVGNEELLEHIFSLKTDDPKLAPDGTTIICAAKLGLISIVQKYLDQIPQSQLLPETLNAAAASGNISLAKYLLELKRTKKKSLFIPTQETLNAAALSGNIECLNFFLSYNLNPEKLTLKNAVFSGNTDMVLFLLDIKDTSGMFLFNPYQELLEIAVAYGRFNMIKLLLEWKDSNDKLLFTLDSFTLRKAIECGNLEILKYLLTFEGKDNCLNIMQSNYHMLFNYGCYSGSIYMLKFILELAYERYGEPHLTQNQKQNIISAVSYSGSIDCMQHLLSLKKEDGTKMFSLNEKASIQSSDLVTYISTLGELALKNAASTGRLRLVQFLLECKGEDGVPVCVLNKDIFITAYESGNCELVKFILNTSRLDNKLIIEISQGISLPYHYSYSCSSYVFLQKFSECNFDMSKLNQSTLDIKSWAKDARDIIEKCPNIVFEERESKKSSGWKFGGMFTSSDNSQIGILKKEIIQLAKQCANCQPRDENFYNIFKESGMLAPIIDYNRDGKSTKDTRTRIAIDSILKLNPVKAGGCKLG